MRILIAIPAYNEEAMLPVTMPRLVAFCRQYLTDDWVVIIADNNSSDTTAAVAQALVATYPDELRYQLVTTPGKGAAIAAAWAASEADIYCFMDADLATDIVALPALIAAVKNGAAVAAGSRWHRQSQVNRSAARRLVSWCYHWLVTAVFGFQIADAACGFKAISRQTQHDIVPLVKDRRWFFDSELILIASHRGLPVQELPVSWYEPRSADNHSRVNIFSVSWQYLRKLWELRQRLRSTR